MRVDHDGPRAILSPEDRVLSLYGERLLPGLSSCLDKLVTSLVTDSAVGLILIDASPLNEIERLYGARPFRRALEGLSDRARTRVAKEFGDGFFMTSGAIYEEQILFFIPRPRADRGFYAAALPQLTQELREYISVCLKRIVYPYLIDPCEIPVGYGMVFHRPFVRPEMQIAKLIASTLESARFEVDRRRRERAAILERIILEEQLSTVYEPIVRLSDRHVIGYEALTRGPVGTGLEGPHRLFSVAYSSSLEYELDSLCRRLALRNAVGIGPDQKLFLNILPTSVHDPDFGDLRVREMLDRMGLAPMNLVLEISEREAISNFQIFREAIGHFSNLGFGIALDDIGSGYSSLETALELAPDYLKIDMSLVRGIDDHPPKQELLRGLQSLAEKLRAEVIAEGIETEEELEALSELGIRCGQGYAIGRGAPSCGPPAPARAEPETSDP